MSCFSPLPCLITGSFFLNNEKHTTKLQKVAMFQACNFPISKKPFMYISCSFLRWMPNSTGAQKEHRGYPRVTWQWKIFNLQMLFSIKSSISGNVHVWLPEDRNWLFNHWRITTTLKQNISALDLRNRGVQILMAQFVGSYHPLSSPVREG